ncbi:hypothetical protein EV426DRAFT_620124 [Tirmania nivea]|nr:hypothetical protein EV426DRAFT_620124 [Tirmania nivea]
MGDIDGFQGKKCSGITEKIDRCLPSDTIINSPRQEIKQPDFDFIVKYPARELLVQLGRNQIETWINDFIDSLFNLGIDFQNETQRVRPPLIYQHHEEIKQDQRVTAVQVRLRLRPDGPSISIHDANLKLCEKIHSIEARENRTCLQYLSNLDIFGLEPVQRTEGQRALESLTAQATSLAANLVAFGTGSCDWLCCNLVCLTQILRHRLSPADVGASKDALFGSLPECPKVLQRLLDASRSLLARFQRYIYGPTPAQVTSNWESVRQVSARMADLERKMAQVAKMAATDQQLMESAKELYFDSKDALQSCTEAILTNKEIWEAFRDSVLRGAADIGVGAGGVVYTVQRSVLSVTSILTPAGAPGAICLALSVIPLYDRVNRFCKSLKYVDICSSLDECLVTTHGIMFSCDVITRMFFFSQNEPTAVSSASTGGHASASEGNARQWWKDFMGEVMRIIGEDPDITVLTLEHYSRYLMAQSDAMRKVRERLNKLLGKI